VKALRLAMRRRRAALRPAEIAGASHSVARHLWRLPALSRAGRIAGYAAIGGEVDCAGLLSAAQARGRQAYLPVLHGGKLVFAPVDPAGGLVRNRFGIPEPAGDGRDWLRGTQLDVVLAPLVAFDGNGRRLGMGGGYYDRTFRFTVHRGRWRRPLLIGLAYDFQRVETLPARDWDVPLHAVVTESGAQFF
jgi:5-formyltetrahydrofolate cyclo-ligase